LTRYIARRIITIIPLLLGISIVLFVLLRLVPGDFADIYQGAESMMSPEGEEYLRRSLDLDLPVYQQYLRWIWRILHGDLGRSMRTGRPVTESIRAGLPVTLELMFLSMLLSVAIGVPLGLGAAVGRNSKVDLFLQPLGVVGLSVPRFWMAMMLLLFVSRGLNWMPPLFWASPFEDPTSNLKQVLLPVITLALPIIALIMRFTRSSLLEVLGQDYMRTARSKGLQESVVLYRHALKNALIPVATVIGMQAAYLMGGSVVVEQIFSLPGIGWLLLSAMRQRDYTVVQATVLFMSSIFVLANLVVDVVYAYLDPRIRYA
jgi:peptide/nickel transport system permease protein